MPPDPPPTIERLLAGPIGSTGTLELLLLLRAGSDRPRQIEELSSAIGSPPSWTELQLEALEDGRLVSRSANGGGWSYAPATPRLASAVEELAGIWQRDRRSVTRWLLMPRG
jgi:DNA-binding IclR family transcriptional regulator